ncbi:polyprenyl synthetase family protein [Streptomyces broussonetiae]|uniref:Polyprenyl synthetase family protein n=1 Tax=Streptomyces broussonetiae TaxID=2686304 RepID=A0ABV5ELN8_9ACTN
MRPTPAKAAPAATVPPVPRPVPLPVSTVRVRPDGPTARPPQRPGPRAVDVDVRAAVGQVLDELLDDRVGQARTVEPLFAADLAERVARFTREGGGRTRPRLLWGALSACGGAEESAGAALRLGAALELLQTCALVHDDVMDDAVRRRGRPALHRDIGARYAGAVPPGRIEAFGTAAAVLAGDLALAWADDTVAATVFPAGVEARVRRIWRDMRTEMVAGQYLDVHGQATGARSLPGALRAACLKSARYSVERPLELGAALAGADGPTTGALCSAGRLIGTAFQLRDDLDDVFGDPARTGKPSGGDIRAGKPTFLLAVARTRARATGDDRSLTALERNVGNARLTRDGLAEVREALERTGARAAVETRIERLTARGLRHFDGASLEGEAGAALRELLVAVGAGARRRGEPVAGGAEGRSGPVATAGEADRRSEPEPVTAGEVDRRSEPEPATAEHTHRRSKPVASTAEDSGRRSAPDPTTAEHRRRRSEPRAGDAEEIGQRSRPVVPATEETGHRSASPPSTAEHTHRRSEPVAGGTEETGHQSEPVVTAAEETGHRSQPPPSTAEHTHRRSEAAPAAPEEVAR